MASSSEIRVTFDLRKRTDRMFLTSSEVKEVLERLAKYYGDRARTAAKEKDDTDIQRACYSLIWQGKKDAVLKVAENLEITLDLGETHAAEEPTEKETARICNPLD